MPVVESRVTVPLPVEAAFAVSQTTGEVRLRWDPFIRRQHFLDGALAPAKGVRTLTVHRLGFRMVSEYVSYAPPTNVGMKMVRGTWFFERLGGGWRFAPVAGDPGSTVATWRYNFACRPRWLAPLAERVGWSCSSATSTGASPATRGGARTRSSSTPSRTGGTAEPETTPVRA